MKEVHKKMLFKGAFLRGVEGGVYHYLMREWLYCAGRAFF